MTKKAGHKNTNNNNISNNDNNNNNNNVKSTPKSTTPARIPPRQVNKSKERLTKAIVVPLVVAIVSVALLGYVNDVGPLSQGLLNALVHLISTPIKGTRHREAVVPDTADTAQHKTDPTSQSRPNTPETAPKAAPEAPAPQTGQKDSDWAKWRSKKSGQNMPGRMDVGLCNTGGPYKTSFSMDTYKRLCNESAYMQEILGVSNKDLFCRYETRFNHPLLIIQPVKAEHVTRYPEMWLYYDLLTDEQISQIQSLAKSRFVKSTITANKAGAKYGFRSQTRNSQTAWIHQGEANVTNNLAKFVQSFTGLNMRAAESMQIAYYKEVGYYDPHFDWFQTQDIGARTEYLGNRFATFLFYLNDVPDGGVTAFPCAGVAVKPKKGQAVLWYNMDDMGRPLVDALHGACEALSGEKWVANWWIREGWRGIAQQCAPTRRRRLVKGPALDALMQQVPSYRRPTFADIEELLNVPASNKTTKNMKTRVL